MCHPNGLDLWQGQDGCALKGTTVYKLCNSSAGQSHSQTVAFWYLYNILSN